MKLVPFAFSRFFVSRSSLDCGGLNARGVVTLVSVGGGRSVTYCSGMYATTTSGVVNIYIQRSTASATTFGAYPTRGSLLRVLPWGDE